MKASTSQIVCEAAGCDRPVLAKCLCNAHYIRTRKGKDLTKPLRVKDPTRGCKIEGCNAKHYGNDYCVKHWKVWNRYNLKRRLIAELGGKCRGCGGIFHPAAFDFHHVEPAKKDFAITEKISRLSFDQLLEEANKCILLCANCHRIHHAGESA